MPDAPDQRRPVPLLGWCVRSALDWFYPRHCYHCGEPLHRTRSHVLCRACFADLSARRIRGHVCALCGLSLAGEPAPGTLCMMCRAERRHLDMARAFLPYASPASSVIRHFKFEGEYFLGPRFLRGLLKLGWLPLEMADTDAVLAVPLHPRRRRERGYDQAYLLARVLAAELRCKLLRGALVRTRYTSQQALLPASKRWDNVRGAFAVRKPEKVRGRRLLLADDVMTSGTTADECAKVLKKAGAAQVKVLTLARTTP